MNKQQSVILAVIACAVLLAALGWLIAPVGAACQAGADSGLCKLIGYGFPLCYAIIAIIGIWTIATKENKTTWAAASLFGISSIAMVQYLFVRIIQDPRTYGYEAFIMGFMLWGAIGCYLLCLCFMLPKHKTRLYVLFVVFTILATIILGVLGRGSIEQEMALFGGLLHQFSVRSLLAGLSPPHPYVFWFGSIIRLWIIFALLVLFAGLIRAIANWVHDNRFVASMIADVKHALWFALFSCMMFLSIVIGKLIANGDVTEAADYIDDIEPLLDIYFEAHGEYPKDLIEILQGEYNPPHLIRRYEYLAMNYKGSYYFSKPEKYCFVFLKSDSPYGYVSKTSEREWRFDPEENKSLEETYLKICDESEMDTAEGMIANRLGISSEEGGQALAEDMNELGEYPTYAVTPSATGRLMDVIGQESIKDPETYLGKFAPENKPHNHNHK